jgi:hypothetical protein
LSSRTYKGFDNPAFGEAASRFERMNAARRLLPRWNRSLPVDLDVFFAAAIGDRNHDAEADHDRDSDQSPRDADALQNTQFPERGQDAANVSTPASPSFPP